MVILAFAQEVQLLPDLTLFFHIALILLMIWFLNRTFFGPINRVLETREKNKGGGATEAEEILSRVAEKEAEYNSALLEARNEGYALIEAERKAAVEQRREKISKVRMEVASDLESALKSLDSESSEAEMEIRNEAEKMAEEISSNILKVA